MVLIICIGLFQHFYMVVSLKDYFTETNALSLISFYSFWHYIMTYDYASLIIYIIPIILIITGVYNFFKLYNSGYFQYMLPKIKYEKLLLKEVLKSWILGGFLLPIISILVFVVSFILYPNSILAPEDLVNGVPFLRMPEIVYENSPIVFFLIATMLMLLFSMIIINTGIIISRYLRNFYLVIILSFLVIIFYETLGSMIIGPFIATIIGVKNVANMFSLYNLYFLDSVPSLWVSLTYSLFLVFITTFIVYCVYRNKEKVILNNE